jgi:hypothetical protein
MKDIQILHHKYLSAKLKDELNACKHLHGIDMQIHTIPKPPHQKIHYMGFSMEYNTDRNDNTPTHDLDYFINTLEHHNQDYDPGINAKFLNNLDPTFYAMQM